MADWFINDPATGRIESNFSEKFGEAARGVVGFFHNTAADMKKDQTVATTVSAMGGIAGFTIGFWALKKFLFEKIGMDGIMGDIASLAGAVVLGLALFNTIGAKDADARASHNRQQWAETHPQNGGTAPRERLGPSEAAELASGGGVKREFNGNASEIEHPYADKSVEDAIKRAHERDSGFSPNDPTKKPPAAPSDVKITVGEPGTDEAPQEIPSGDIDLVARAPAPRNGMRGPGFG